MAQKGAGRRSRQAKTRTDAISTTISCLEALHYCLMFYSFVLRRGFGEEEDEEEEDRFHSPRFIVAL